MRQITKSITVFFLMINAIYNSPQLKQTNANINMLIAFALSSLHIPQAKHVCFFSFSRCGLAAVALTRQQWKNPLLTERSTRDRLLYHRKSVMCVSFLNSCVVCHCHIFVLCASVGVWMRLYTVCNVLKALWVLRFRKSVGNLVFPAFSIHRGNEGLTPKTRAHT